MLVGTILLGHIAHIEWDDIGIAIPAFLTMVLMPFTYSGGPRGVVERLGKGACHDVAGVKSENLLGKAPGPPRWRITAGANNAVPDMRASTPPLPAVQWPMASSLDWSATWPFTCPFGLQTRCGNGGGPQPMETRRVQTACGAGMPGCWLAT